MFHETLMCYIMTNFHSYYKFTNQISQVLSQNYFSSFKQKLCENVMKHFFSLKTYGQKV